MSTMCAMPSSPVPKRLVTQTLPWLSMFRPLLLEPDVELGDLARVGGREAEDVVGAVRDPDPVLLVDGQVERAR